MTDTLKVTARGEREVVMTREFNAPRNLVFEAWTKPELLKRWLNGPDEWRLTVCEVDLKVGGAVRFEWRHSGTKSMGMSGVYREIVPLERIVFTEVWDDDWTNGEAVSTITFTEYAGKTTLTQTVVYSSRDTRDAVLKTGMAKGVERSYDRLAALLATTPGR